MAEVAKRFSNIQFCVATVSNLNEDLYKAFEGLSNVKFINEDAYNLLLHAQAAIVTSGTATLETALLKVPQIVIYKTSGISYRIAKYFIRVPFISLVNLIAGKKVVKELIQNDMNAEAISTELQLLLNDSPYRRQMLQEYDKIYATLDIGSASENAAKLMIGYLKQS